MFESVIKYLLFVLIAGAFLWVNRYEVNYSKDLGIAGHYRFDRWRQCVEVYSSYIVRDLLKERELTAQDGRCPPSEEEIAAAEAEQKAWQIENEQNKRIDQAARNILLQRCINAGDTKDVCEKKYPQSCNNIDPGEMLLLRVELRSCLKKDSEATCFQKVK